MPCAGRTLLVHTEVPFGIEHLEDDKSAVKELILGKLNASLVPVPRLPLSFSHFLNFCICKYYTQKFIKLEKERGSLGTSSRLAQCFYS